MNKTIAILTVLFFIVTAFNVTHPIAFYIPKGWPKPIYDLTKNPLTQEKIELGRALFYDPILSRDSTISCNSCHAQYSAFTHIDHPVSHGIDNKIGNRNAPALMNLAWNSSFMWDGAINHVDMQALAPMSNSLEMDETLANVVTKLQHTTRYPKLYKDAFGDSMINGVNTLKAISQFMLSLVSCQSKYDSVMRRESNFTQQEQNGYILFKANCSTCHKEPLFTNDKFENNGLPMDTFYKDLGRMKVTNDSADYLRFRVPTLRNVQYSFPYMHDGRFKRLSEVLNHYTKGIVPSKSLSKPLLKPILLSSNDKVDIIAFLYTLTDHHFLYNEQFSYPKNTLSH